MPDAQPEYPPDMNELQRRFTNAAQYVTETNQRGLQAALDVAKEKTQYLEKIALAAGGTIALMVSFVGAHAGRLQPPWLLRASLVTLVLTMIAAMYRNWRYPFYVMDTHKAKQVGALLDREKATCESMKAGRAYDGEGIPIDGPAYLAKSATEQIKAEKFIAELQKKAARSLTIVQVVEYAALVLILSGMAMLVALAWINF